MQAKTTCFYRGGWVGDRKREGIKAVGMSYWKLGVGGLVGWWVGGWVGGRTHRSGTRMATAIAAIQRIGKATRDLYRPSRRITKEVPVREKRKEMAFVI